MSGDAFEAGDHVGDHRDPRTTPASSFRVNQLPPYTAPCHPAPPNAQPFDSSSPLPQRFRSTPLISSPLAHHATRPTSGLPISSPPFTPQFASGRLRAHAGGDSPFDASGPSSGCGGGPSGAFKLFQNLGGLNNAARRANTSNAPQNRTLPGYSPRMWKDRFKRQCQERLKEVRQAKFDSARAALSPSNFSTAPKGKLPGASDGVRRRINSGGALGETWEEELVRLEWRKFCAQNEMSCMREYGNVLTPEMASEMEEELLNEMRQENSASDHACSIEDHYDRYLAEEENALRAAISAREDELTTCMAVAVEFVLLARCFKCGTTPGSWFPLVEAEMESCPAQDTLAVGCRSCDARLDRAACYRLGSSLITHRNVCADTPFLLYHHATGLILMCSSCEVGEAIA